uniref:Uncharacterized protein n=1 Tax=Branchiostoma floridae TaxID=7739 RepID=C3XUU1_BRAFL|eukprot:XP_002612157.1 hypothetical protein BRAFLDRAFT_88896 [Branchiostoma floridae]
MKQRGVRKDKLGRILTAPRFGGTSNFSDLLSTVPRPGKTKGRANCWCPRRLDSTRTLCIRTTSQLMAQVDDVLQRQYEELNRMFEEFAMAINAEQSRRCGN